MTPATVAVDGRPVYADARRSLVALISCCLSVVPLHGIFSDWMWLFDAWIAMALTLGPAILLRLRYAPRFIHLLPGVLLAIGYLTLRYVPQDAVAGVIPLGGAWHDVSTLVDQFTTTIHDRSAPLPSTPAIRMVVSAQMVLVAVAVDLLAVLARRPALAGVPFLLVFTLAGAVPRQAVDWKWFLFAAAGYLLLLASDQRDELAQWGRMMPRSSTTRIAVRAMSGRRIAAMALAVALVLPWVLPGRSSNVISDALHNGNTSITNGGGSGKGVKLDALATLKGNLVEGTPVSLLTVHTDAPPGKEPYYIRQTVLDTFNGKAWTAGDNGDLQPIDQTSFASMPPTVSNSRFSYTASFTVANLAEVAPTFQDPIALSGLRTGSQWSAKNQVLVGPALQPGQQYTETVSQPDPSAAVLAQAQTVGGSEFQQWLNLPSQPKQVTDLVTKLTKDAKTPYAKTKAISDFFSDPANNFQYSLSTPAGDSDNDLVNFLKSRKGFCQQYAAAMTVMLREAGVPARVVLGYTHSAPDKNGNFTVTTHDAHAWVEAYFGTAGWVPFDPTPLVQGNQGDRAQTVPYAPPVTSDAPAQTQDGNTPTVHPGVTTPAPSAQPTAPAIGSATGTMSAGPNWAVLGVLLGVIVVVLALLTPLVIRLDRRRRRLHAARSAGHADQLWAELAATASDLGYVWSPVRTPRQTVGWLSGQGLAADLQAPLGTLAAAVEQDRYAPPSADGVVSDELVADLRAVEDGLRAGRSRGRRLRARLLPPSLGRLSGARRH
jgi:transglutaminase-like putative cysteine protease